MDRGRQHLTSTISATTGSALMMTCGEYIDDCEASMLQQLDTLRNMKGINQEFVDSVFSVTRFFKLMKGQTQVLGRYDTDFDIFEYL